MTSPAPSLVSLAQLPELGVAARAVRSAAGAAFRSRGPLTAPSVDELPDSAALTPHGNLRELLGRGPRSSDERLLLGALLALALRAEAPFGAGSAELGAELLWLAARARCDALPYLDESLGEHAAPLWDAIGRLAEPSADREVPLQGELSAAPHGPVATALLAVSGWLLVAQIARVVARLALGVRRPAELRLSGRGLELRQRTVLLGKLLRDREIVVPLGSVLRVTREVRYARLGMYAGLFALAVGTYFGMGLVTDAVRVPGTSPSLLAFGVLLIALGLAADFGLTSLSETVRGRCRVVIEVRKGRTLCVGSVDPALADAMLESLARRAGARGSA